MGTKSHSSYQIGNTSAPPSPNLSPKIKAEWLWENVVKWISFVEESLFQLPPPDDIFTSSDSRQALAQSGAQPSDSKKDSSDTWRSMKASSLPSSPRDSGTVQSKPRSIDSPLNLSPRSDDKGKDRDIREQQSPTVNAAQILQKSSGQAKGRQRSWGQLSFVSAHFLLPIFHSAPEERGIDPYLNSTHSHSPTTMTFQRKREATAKNNISAKRAGPLERRAPHPDPKSVSGKATVTPDRTASLENSKWVDFHFAQRLLDLIDDLLLLPVSSSATTPFVAVRPLLSFLSRN